MCGQSKETCLLGDKNMFLKFSVVSVNTFFGDDGPEQVALMVYAYVDL